MNEEILEQKKDILLKILESLTPSWDIAKGLYVLVNDIGATEELIDSILGIIKDAMGKVDDLKTKEVFKKSVDALEKMKQVENDERKGELDEIEESLKKLESMY